MNKVEYLEILKDYLLKTYSKEESLEILRDYEEYFINGKLDGKSESEIIFELGSPKKIVEEIISEDEERKELNIFEKVKVKTESFIGDKVFNKNFDFEKVVKVTDFKNVWKVLIGTFVISIIFLFLGFIGFSVVFGMVGLTCVFSKLMKVENNEMNFKREKLIWAINIFIIFLYFMMTFSSYGRGKFFELEFGFLVTIFMVVVDFIFLFAFAKFAIPTILQYIMFFFVMFFPVMLLLFFVLLTFLGVSMAIFLTPLTLTGLEFLSMSYAWIILPIMLAVGLFIGMCILIKYYSKLLYEIFLNFTNWIKLRSMYYEAYKNSENVKEEYDEKR